MKYGVENACCTAEAAEAELDPAHRAVGSPWLTSLANDGPERTAMLSPSTPERTSLSTPLAVSRVDCSMPLVALTSTAPAGTKGDHTANTDLMPCEGTT